MVRPGPQLAIMVRPGPQLAIMVRPGPQLAIMVRPGPQVPKKCAQVKNTNEHGHAHFYRSVLDLCTLILELLWTCAHFSCVSWSCYNSCGPSRTTTVKLWSGQDHNCQLWSGQDHNWQLWSWSDHNWQWWSWPWSAHSLGRTTTGAIMVQPGPQLATMVRPIP